MKLGISTYTYGWRIGVKDMNEFDLIDTACRHHIDIIQLGDNLPFHTFSARRRKAFAGALQANNLSVELGAKKMTASHLKQYILLCRESNSSILRFLIDDNRFRPSLKEVERIIRSQIALLKNSNVLLAIENHDRFKAKALRSLIENLGYKEVGICLDTVNSLGVGEGIESVTAVLAPYTYNLHIKDFIVKRLPHKMGFRVEGCLVGRGLLDIPGLLRQLGAFNKCPTAVLEQWTVPDSTIRQTIMKEGKWARLGIKYLQSVFNTEYNSNGSK